MIVETYEKILTRNPITYVIEYDPLVICTKTEGLDSFKKIQQFNKRNRTWTLQRTQSAYPKPYNQESSTTTTIRSI